MDIRYNWLLIGAVFLLGCTNHIDKNINENIVEVRKYSISAFPEKDLIWFDTVYLDRPSKDILWKIVHGIDSVLMQNKVDSFMVADAEIVLVNEVKTEEYEFYQYHLEYPIEKGSLSILGIWEESVGTVYIRWLDGHKTIRLLERKVSDEIFLYKKMQDYLDSTILSIPPRPENGDGEVIEEIELDTLIIK
ncbi:MAG: hypothetical protein JJU23_15630 [Cyclobacteriaceae bacterium]|nr:hypothetical protein [Cyclobacteriaceae bacterium]